MQYARGIQMKKRIFRIAKALIYTHGYKKTTYSMIAQEAEVPVGLVNYYFKKRDLLDEIYEEFIKRIDLTIVAQAGDRIQNNLQTHIVMSGIMLTQIFSDPRTLALQLEVTEGNLLSSRVHDKIRLRLIDALKRYPTTLSEENDYWYVIAEYGARRELILQNKDISVTDPNFKELRDLLATITIRIVDLSHEIIDENLKNANEILESLDYSHIKLL